MENMKERKNRCAIEKHGCKLGDRTKPSCFLPLEGGGGGSGHDRDGSGGDCGGGCTEQSLPPPWR